MANLLDFRKNLAEVSDRKVLIQIMLDAAYQLRALLIDLNQIQLESGKDINGRVLGRYSRATEIESLFGEIKPIQDKREGEPYNFEWTGGLFDGMKIVARKQSLEFTSSDSKTPLLVAKYGEIFGLTEKHMAEAVEKIIPLFLEEICKRLQI